MRTYPACNPNRKCKTKQPTTRPNPTLDSKRQAKEYNTRFKGGFFRTFAEIGRIEGLWQTLTPTITR